MVPFLRSLYVGYCRKVCDYSNCSVIQSAVVILNSKGLSEILRDIRTSIYQICRIEEKIIRKITFNKFIFRDISKYC